MTEPLANQPSRTRATLALDEGVASLRGVAAGRATALSKLGITTVRDLLNHFPRRYIDVSRVSTVAQARIGESCTITGEIYEVVLKRPKTRMPALTEITLVDGTGTLIVTFFRQPWLAEKHHKGERIAVAGKIGFFGGFKTMTNPFLEPLDGTQAEGQGSVIPVHPATKSLTTAQIRRLEAEALARCRGVEDPLPLGLRTRYMLYSRYEAWKAVHFPRSMEDVSQARRRLVFEELLLLELHLLRAAQRRAQRGAACAHVCQGPHVRALDAAMPFSLTEEQLAARDQMLARMAEGSPANHMILGDVGTGKTAVAAFALAAAADTGTQALMMGPTEVLVSQYAAKLGPLFDTVGITWAALTGAAPAAQRAHILEDVAAGRTSVLFGTHALLEPDVVVPACSLVVIDEQQRFGTEQRAALAAKGAGAPDILYLTATPIPRSLALALYGDMSLSYIRQRPHGTEPTETRVFSRAQYGEVYDLAREELEAGHQVYVVCPLVGRQQLDSDQESQAAADAGYCIDIEGDSDMGEGDPRAAVKQAEYLRTKIFGGFEVEVLHGRMKSEEKAAVMDAFRSGEVQVLVSTTVIEVGVDVPNATVMIVEDADRFGLSQLHQLRGRVGRGQHAGHMCLVSGSKAPAALERLAAMERTSDGFELAEYDLSLRREGDILGNRQHGASVLKLVNVMRDAAVIEEAHKQAEAILAADPELGLPEHRGLRMELARAFPDPGFANRSG